jgi:hypothetical protein
MGFVKNVLVHILRVLGRYHNGYIPYRLSDLQFHSDIDVAAVAVPFPHVHLYWAENLIVKSNGSSEHPTRIQDRIIFR